MSNVINFLKDFQVKIVTVSGAPGVGKSALIAGSCQYLAARDVFKEGIIFVRLGHHAVTQSRFLELIEDALVKQSKAVQSRLEKDRGGGGYARSPESSLNSPGISSGGLGSGNIKLPPSPLPPLPHPRVPRASDVSGPQKRQEALASQAATDADREAWIIEALKDCNGLLVVDHADALLLDNNTSGDEEEGRELWGFLERLFDGAPNTKLLSAISAIRSASSSTSGSSKSVLSTGRMVSLEPLSLRDAAHLFCRRSPQLCTNKERYHCLEFLAPPHQAQAREAALLAALGDGFLGRIVQFALKAEASLNELVSIANAYPLHAPPMPLAPCA